MKPNQEFAYEALILLADRVKSEDFALEARTFYDVKNWISLMININNIFSNHIFPDQQFVTKDIENASSDFGKFFSEEIKKTSLLTSQNS